ncbi:glucose oxidase precursor [Penicillium angulare]|uniref:glucose oxidase n=1 Tax=Penicillium angulare TaxID=116970 RepID=A0A9W9KPJ8_9EURO|nr:glucose oxidase precursor [Penicillium angulare]
MALTKYLIFLIIGSWYAEGAILTDPHEAIDREYDYIIAGGGLTGLTAAAKLTQNENIKVLVIESGFLQSTRGPLVESVTEFGQAFGTSIDHNFQTVELDINDRPLTIHSGNGLGGSTLINGASYTSPAKIQIDSWESHLGNKGWNWENLSYYIHQMEHTHRPTRDQIKAGHCFDPNCHGDDGPVHISARDTGSQYSPIIRSFMKMLERLGVPTRKDLSCGDPRGVSMFLNTIHENQTRSDTARELLLPIVDRPNLSILVGHRVGRVLVHADQSHPSVKGVEFGTDGQKFEVLARHEVILATGALVTPLILEYSGIGLKSVLEAAEVPQIVDLPAATTLSTSIHPKGAGQGQAIYFAAWEEIFKNSNLVIARELLDSQLDQWAHDAVEKGGLRNSTAAKMQMELYRDWILNNNVSYTEFFLDTSSTTFRVGIWILLTFARGYVHIVDKDPYLWRVVRNPRYLENELDRFAHASAFQLARNLTQDSSMWEYIQDEMFPGSAIPQNASLDDWISHTTQTFQPSYHAIGTCAMMSRELGGVVDPSGRVYGVRNLRIIDASIVPTQVSAHPSALLYGMANKLAEDIVTGYHVSIRSASFHSFPSFLRTKSHWQVRLW